MLATRRNSDHCATSGFFLFPHNTDGVKTFPTTAKLFWSLLFITIQWRLSPADLSSYKTYPLVYITFSLFFTSYISQRHYPSYKAQFIINTIDYPCASSKGGEKTCLYCKESLLQRKPNGFVCLPWNKQTLRSMCVKKGNDLQMGLMHSE